MKSPEIAIVETPAEQPEGDPAATDAHPTACHRSWLVGFQQARPQMRMRGGKIVDPSGGQPVMVPVPGMMPCIGQHCMKWNAKYEKCTERVIDDLRIEQLEAAGFGPSPG